MSTEHKPNVLIFASPVNALHAVDSLGGTNTLVGALIDHLIPPPPAEPLISHVRITDRFSINPPTTYVSKNLRRLLEERKDLVEYRQRNLTNSEAVTLSYTDPSPNGLPYSIVMDLGGDFDYDHPAAAHIAHTLETAINIARCSAAQLARSPGSIKAHIRGIPQFYEHTDDGKRYTEEDPKGWVFDAGKGAVRALWWHETLRAVGNIPDLPLLAVRFALPYGPGMLGYEVTSMILLGLVYQHAKKDMKLIWSPKLPKNTINMVDFAGFVWAAAQWISTKTRAEANALVGVPIYPSNDASLTTTPPPSRDVVPASVGPVIVPVLNAVDEGDSTQRSISEVVGEVFGVEVGFHSSLAEFLARWKMKDMIENVNGMHLEHWTNIITTSNPPVPNTPLSPYIALYQLEEHGCALDGEKARNFLDYKFRYPRFDKSAVLNFIEWCRNEGLWPETNKISEV